MYSIMDEACVVWFCALRCLTVAKFPRIYFNTHETPKNTMLHQRVYITHPRTLELSSSSMYAYGLSILYATDVCVVSGFWPTPCMGGAVCVCSVRCVRSHIYDTVCLRCGDGESRTNVEDALYGDEMKAGFYGSAPERNDGRTHTHVKCFTCANYAKRGFGDDDLTFASCTFNQSNSKYRARHTNIYYYIYTILYTFVFHPERDFAKKGVCQLYTELNPHIESIFTTQQSRVDWFENMSSPFAEWEVGR